MSTQKQNAHFLIQLASWHPSLRGSQFHFLHSLTVPLRPQARECLKDLATCWCRNSTIYVQHVMRYQSACGSQTPLNCFCLNRWKKSLPTSVENILEDQLGSLVVEGRHSSEKLKETHSQRPPVHHAVWKTRHTSYSWMLRHRHPSTQVFPR